MKYRITAVRVAGKLRQMIFGIHSPSAIAAGALDPHEMKDAFLKGVCEQTRSEALEMYEVGKYAALGLQSAIKKAKKGASKNERQKV